MRHIYWCQRGVPPLCCVVGPLNDKHTWGILRTVSEGPRHKGDKKWRVPPTDWCLVVDGPRPGVIVWWSTPWMLTLWLRATAPSHPLPPVTITVTLYSMSVSKFSDDIHGSCWHVQVSPSIRSQPQCLSVRFNYCLPSGGDKYLVILSWLCAIIRFYKEVKLSDV